MIWSGDDLARAVAADRDRLVEPTGPTHPAVVEAMRLLDSQLAHSWTPTELADQLHLSSGYLLRLFKSSTGMPPMAYLARRRVETAAGLLLHTDQPVTQIGRSVGWPDQNYFARRFKAHFGLSATTYRSRFADSARQLQPWPAGPAAAHRPVQGPAPVGAREAGDSYATKASFVLLGVHAVLSAGSAPGRGPRPGHGRLRLRVA
jgi:AraC-like DNA-binding protein